MSANRHTLLALLALVVMISACDRRHSLLPRSGGKPSEVLIVGDYDNLLSSELTQTVAGLPQTEPCFDVSVISHDRLNQTTRLARNIVVTDIDSRRHSHLHVSYEKDVYAYPQMIVTVESPSVSEIKEKITSLGSKLRTLLSRAETNREIVGLEDSHNATIGEKVEQIFGWTMLIPPDMRAMKTADGFVWLSDDGRAVQRNICLYTLPEGCDVVSGRDSMMAINIPGEQAGMHMRTASVSVKEESLEGTERITVYRGLWEMKGDAMGGPYTLHVHNDSTSGKLLIAEVFVYAPGQKKRNLMRQLEASLYTLRH